MQQLSRRFIFVIFIRGKNQEKMENLDLSLYRGTDCVGKRNNKKKNDKKGSTESLFMIL